MAKFEKFEITLFVYKNLMSKFLKKAPTVCASHLRTQEKNNHVKILSPSGAGAAEVSVIGPVFCAKIVNFHKVCSDYHRESMLS